MKTSNPSREGANSAAVEPPTSKLANIALRRPRPGDLGWVIQRHGELYASELGYGEDFEALVARIAADFIESADPSHERCWIAEFGGTRVGSVLLVRDRDLPATARLRLLLVEPRVRGMGLGQRLVDECTSFAREAGYERIVLWTRSNLLAARRAYGRAGYVCIGSEQAGDFCDETWELELARS